MAHFFFQSVAKRNFNENFFVFKIDTMHNSNPASSTDQYKLIYTFKTFYYLIERTVSHTQKVRFLIR